MRLKCNWLLAASLAGLLASSASVGWASSHREAPRIAGLPRVDSTDFYMFRSYEPGRDKFVTFIANYMPLQQAYGGPNYYKFDEDAVYEIHVDNNGDAVEDLTFRFDFDSRLRNQGSGIALKVGGKSIGIPLRQAGQIAEANPPALNDPESYTLRLVRGPRRTGTAQPVVSGQGAAPSSSPSTTSATRPSRTTPSTPSG
jgi:hypothetical protein